MLNPVFKSPTNENYFFGYYDKSPLDYSNNKLLAMKTQFIDRLPEKDDKLEIGCFRWKDDCSFHQISDTTTWNWQQGCMLQWLGPDYKSRIIFNDRIDDKYVSKIINLDSGAVTVLPTSIYAVHPAGTYALCIDYERYYWCRRGYAYSGIENIDKNKPIYNDEGIWLLNIESEELNQIININQLLDINPLSSMNGAMHYIEHIMFNPSGERFCFFHRWKLDDGGVYTRLYTSDINGNDIYLLHDTGRATHFCWRDDEQILLFGGVHSKITNVRKNKTFTKITKLLVPLYHAIVRSGVGINQLVTGDSYMLLRDKTDKLSKLEHEGLHQDGHPTFKPMDKNEFLSDTYEDEKGYRNLFVCNLPDNSVSPIDRLKSNSDYDNTTLRCDLHPRWSYDGGYICIDTISEYNRSVYLYKV